MRHLRSLAAALAAAPFPVYAHSPIEGIGQFYGGLLHPLLVLPHALALGMFALLVGQRGLPAMRFAYPPFVLLLIVGLGLAGFGVTQEPPVERALLAIGLLCGLMVALEIAPPRAALAGLGAALALLVGADSGVDGLTRQQTFAALLGCWLGAVVLLIVIAGVAELAQRSWQRIAVRVAGSWGTASAVLVLALALRGG